MIPPSFDYHSPKTLSEAIGLLSKYGEGAKVLSGGQSLLPLLKLRLGSAGHLVDIGRVPGLEDIKEDGGMLKIGGRVRESDLEHSDVVRRKYPILADTAAVIADPLVRNLATVGGNLATAIPPTITRPRCSRSERRSSRWGRRASEPSRSRNSSRASSRRPSIETRS